ncbi:MAG: DUF433 domain-containing protein [Chloroflexota bacterium]
MDRISINPKIRFGKPCVVGTRITVQEVLELINARISFQDIMIDYYPDLKIDDIHACMEYAIALVSTEEVNFASALVTV